MNKTVIFAGTTEGRQLSEGLATAGIAHTVCVATEYGELVLTPHPLVCVKTGRMEEAEMQAFLEAGCDTVYDATHPFAKVVTENIKAACRAAGTEYVRVLRSRTEAQQLQDMTAGRPEQAAARKTQPAAVIADRSLRFFADAQACAAYLKTTCGNILLTTGSKELSVYAQEESVKSRLYARVLPSEESLRLCGQAGLFGKQILAMHGPFCAALNEALIRQFDIRCLVTKQSGAAGGYYEKLEAALRCGIEVCVIGRPEEETGVTVEEVLHHYGANMPLQLTLIGCGPGSEKLLTVQAKEAIEQADAVFGAGRLLEGITGKAVYPYYLARDVIPLLEGGQIRRAALLFSGDSGFFSGTEKMKAQLEGWSAKENKACTIRICPGISSLSYLAAVTGEAYQDAPFVSLHGKSQEESVQQKLLQAVRANEKVFLILSGAADVRLLGQLLAGNDLEQCEILLGYELSYPQEQLLRLSAKDCLQIEKEGLYAAIIKNPAGKAQAATTPAQQVREHAGPVHPNAPFLPDEAFERLISGDGGTVPMTKEPIRHASIIRLQLHQGAVVYDVGSGTGSVSVEAALFDPSIRVYAIERKEAAAQLTRKNAERFGCDGVQVITGVAPEAFAGLEAPTHVFIGGSGGNLKEILAAIREKAPQVRVVLNAVSLETIAEATALLADLPVTQLQIEQLSVSRSRKLGDYHLMNAENPVMIFSFTLQSEGGLAKGDRHVYTEGQ